MSSSQSKPARLVVLVPLVFSTIWFVAFVLLACFVTYVLILTAIAGSVWAAFSQLSLIVAMLIWFAVLPALLWGSVLLAARILEFKISMWPHLIISELAAISALPIFLVLYNYVEAAAISPENPDPDFDKLGFVGVGGVYGSLSLLIIFPLLAMLFYRFAIGLRLESLLGTPSEDQ